MNTIYKFSITILLVLFNIQSKAQVQVEKSDEIVFILNKKYYLHNVESGQTLYSICRVYNVSEADIYTENEEIAKHGLKAGSQIKIPFKDQNTITSIEPEQKELSKEYIYHKVTRKQTIYFLTRKYNISETELIKLNPEIKNGIKPGQKIKVPKQGTIKISKKGDYRYHAIQPGETLFSIAYRYGVTIPDLKRENPELNDGIRLGLILRVPVSSKSYSELLSNNNHNEKNNSYGDYDPLYFEESNFTPCSDYIYEKGHTFKVAVMLPLYIKENNDLRFSSKYYKNSGKFYEFYNGLLLAAKKMKNQGVSIEFQIHDTKGSTEEVNKIISQNKLQDADLIIGPVYSSNFKIASGFAKKHKINIIAPFRLKNKKIVVTNPYAFLASPSHETEIENISNFLTKKYDKSILVIHEGSFQELEAIELFKKKLIKSFSSYDNINEIVFKQVNYKNGGNTAVENALSVGLHNIVIIPSTNQVFITQLVSKLNYLTDNYNITIYGMSAWEQFRNIEIDYLRNLQFHYGTTTFVDKNANDVKNFNKQYSSYYKSDASEYSYLGYDVCYYFSNILKDYGKHFQFCLPTSFNKDYSKGLRFNFNFERVSPFSGFENNWLRIVKIDNELNIVTVN